MKEALQAKDVQEVVEAVRNLVKGEQEKGLKCPTTDEFLLRFIKASNYNAQNSFHLIKRYFKAKIEEPEAFVVQSPAKYLKMIQRTDLGLPLKDLDNTGRRILHIKFGLLDPRVEDWTSVVQTAMIIVEAFSLEEDVQDNGVSLIVNCQGFSLKIMKWATPHKIRILLAFFQDCIPLRFELVHIINYPTIFNVFYSALSPFIHEEVKRKFVWHSNLTTLEKYMDKKSLPMDLGGQLEDEVAADWYKFVVDKEEIFAEFRKMGYELPSKPSHSEKSS